MQYLYAAKTVKKIKMSGLIFFDHFGKYTLDSVKNIAGTDTAYVYGRRFNQKGVNTRITSGVFLTGFVNTAKSVLFTAAFYYQGGKDRDALKLSAYTTTLSLSYIRKRFSYTAGWDYVSGNDAFSSSATNHRFDPLYGTPHKFWGYMDYFFAGTGSPTGGLNNPFLSLKYNGDKKKFSAGADYQYFALVQNQKDISGYPINKYLGSEIEVVANYSLNKFINLEWGFSIMAATKSMEYAKAIPPGTSSLTATWTYMMINIKPEFVLR